MNAVFSFARLGALLIKEFIQMRRDRITFAMMLGVPLMQLVLFGFAINNDPKSLPAALVATSNDHYTRAMVSALETTGYYRFDHRGRERGGGRGADGERRRRLRRHHPGRFRAPRRARRSPADPDRGRRHRSVGRLGRHLDARHRGLDRRCCASRACRRRPPRPRRSQLEVVVHRRYNPEGISQYNIVPGLLGVILQMTLVMMTSIALTRETERGTMENLLAMPASPLEIMLGKVLPYLVVGAVQVVVVLVAAKLLFSVPFVGSLPLLLGAILVFVHGAGAARLHHLDRRAHADAGDAADLLLLPAVDPAVGLHVPLSRHARLGAVCSARSSR